eukprot:m.857335 g.857335  ORF g.857335 m.857335 type:complete len:77 (-) comp59647_c0_seq2:417-647(-)
MQQEVKVAREKQMQQLLSEMVAKKAAEEARLAQEVIDMTANHTEKLGWLNSSSNTRQRKIASLPNSPKRPSVLMKR